MLLTYYLFLVADLVLMAAFRGSPLFPQTRKAHMVYLLVPPLILLTSVLNLGFVATLILSVALIILSNFFFRRNADFGMTPAAVGYSLGLWCLQAILPLSIHFTLRSRPETERWSLLIGGIMLLSATVLVFAVLGARRQQENLKP